MGALLRTSIALGLAFCGLFVVGCDSDDPAETGLVNGRYVAEADLTENVTEPATGESADVLHADRSRPAGVCCFVLDLDLASSSDGAIGGTGIITYPNPEGSEALPPQSVDVTGTTEGAAVDLGIALEDRSMQFEFGGTVSEDGGTITGSFEGFVGVPIVFERVP